MDTKLRDIRKLYSIRNILGVSAGKRVINCPLPVHIHYNNTPSFSIGYGKDGVEHFHCHGNCGKEGDVIDLVGYMSIPNYNDHDPEMVSRAISLLTNKYEISITTPQYEEEILPNNIWRQYPMAKEAYDYAVSRGLKSETIDKFRLGQKGNYALMIPVFCEGILRAIKFRTFSGNGPRYFAERGSKKSLFNVDNVMWKEEPVLILKGEIAVMLLDGYGFNTCCMTGGEGAKIEEWKHYLSFATKLVLVGDNDINPETRERMQGISKKRAEEWGAVLKFPPKEYKDIDEWVLANQDALITIRSWI